MEEHDQGSLLDYRCAFLSPGEGKAKHKGSDQNRRFVTLSLGLRPAPLMAFFVEAARESIGSQIAVKLSYEAMLEAAFTAVEGRTPAELSSIDIVQEAFKIANQRVYQYAHRMLSGGKVSANGTVLAFDGKRVSIGQVGAYESVLFRDGKMLRFHESPGSRRTHREGILERFIGANAQILVDLASVRVKDTDVVIITSLPPEDRFLSLFQNTLRTMASLDEACGRLSNAVRLLVKEDSADISDPVVFVLQVGPPTIVLRNVVFEEFS